MDIVVALSLSAVACMGCVCWLLRERDAFLNHRAGALLRRAVAETAFGIMADPKTTAEARVFAEAFLEAAYRPFDVNVLRVEKHYRSDERPLDQMGQSLGEHVGEFDTMASHVALLLLLNHRASGRHVRKFIDGTRELDETLAKIGATASLSGGPHSAIALQSRDSVKAGELAATFARAEHHRLVDDLINVISRNAKLIPA